MIKGEKKNRDRSSEDQGKEEKQLLSYIGRFSPVFHPHPKLEARNQHTMS